jgi:hypothetical protein
MRKRLTVIVAMLTIAGPAFAEPAKPAAKPASKPQAAAEIVLASADVVRPAATQSVASTTPPAKRRIARVTSCRCGDPQADPEQQEQ